MLMVYAPRAITYPDSYILNEALPCKTTHANSLNNISICLGPIRAPCSSLLSASSFYWKSRNQLSGPKKWLVSVHTCSLVFHFKEKIFFFIYIRVCDIFCCYLLQCQMHDSIPSDDEYRSSRNIAISLFRRYRNVLDRGGGDNLKVY